MVSPVPAYHLCRGSAARVSLRREQPPAYPFGIPPRIPLVVACTSCL